jgi:hypothetical protein
VKVKLGEARNTAQVVYGELFLKVRANVTDHLLDPAVVSVSVRSVFHVSAN